MNKKGGDSKSKNDKAGIYYILPASTQITIGDGLNTVFSEQFFMPQFGITVPLAESLFKQTHIKVQLDSQTGRLLRIE